MLWQEEHDRNAATDDVVDISFRIECRELPIDHAWLLYESIRSKLSWIDSDPDFGIHSIHGAASGNGWMRPPDTNGVLQLSKRTRLYLRARKEQIKKTMVLSEQALALPGYTLNVKQGQIKSITASKTLFSRSVLYSNNEDEVAFTHRIAKTLDHQGISVTKLLCGLPHDIYTPQQTLHARSVLIADLKPEQSLHLQKQGFGDGRHIGCGIFLPHKSLAAVGKSQ